MTEKKNKDGKDDSIGGFKTRSYDNSELITNQEVPHQFTAKEKKKNEK